MNEVIIGVLIAAGGAVALGVLGLARKAARWLWRRNVAEPVTKWAELRIAAVVGSPNGRGKLYPMVEELHEMHVENPRLHPPVPPVAHG